MFANKHLKKKKLKTLEYKFEEKIDFYFLVEYKFLAYYIYIYIRTQIANADC